MFATAVEEVKSRMSNIRHKILILSGKGGVGKTTFTAQMAFSFASDENTQVHMNSIQFIIIGYVYVISTACTICSLRSCLYNSMLASL